MQDNNIKISGYVTVKDAQLADLPFEASIRSALDVCEEVCVVNTSVTDDGTTSLLLDLQKEFPEQLKVLTKSVDWSAPNHGVLDGQLKQVAREMCVHPYLLQFDADEVFHEDQVEYFRPLVEQLQPMFEVSPLLALPVIEYWGSNDKIRLDVNLWKWRLSKNVPYIQHGIPLHLRTKDKATGLLYAKQGTDGCDYISKGNGMPIAPINIIPDEIEKARQEGVANPVAGDKVRNWLEVAHTKVPVVHHYSWIDIERKIKHYRTFWHKSWKSLYNEDRSEQTNPFFPGQEWSDVSDEMIKAKALELATKTSGWIFHRPWDGSSILGIQPPTNMTQPKYIKSWLEARAGVCT